MEDHIKTRDHIAKIRNLLFRHEVKSKRIKRIKSKTYHRLKNKDLKKSSLGALMDPEMAKEEAMRQEAKRVEVSLKFPHIFHQDTGRQGLKSCLVCVCAGTSDVKAQKHREVGEAHGSPWTECEI